MNKNENQAQTSWSAVKFAWELGYTIAIPLIVFAVAGALLDRWLGTKPWFLLGGVIISMFISTLGMYLKAMKIISRQATNDQKNQDKETKK